MIQTHISWVFITDAFAYKLKKPVDLGFLNFTTLRRRHHYLNEELSLNRRLCPEIYLEVLPITEVRGRVRVGGQGRALDYILRMRRMPQNRIMDEVADRGELHQGHLDRIIERLYSHAAKVGKTLYIAGQVARDIQGRLVGKGDFGAQARQVYTNLKNILQETGGGLKNIVKTTTILTHYSNVESYKKIRDEFFGKIMPPNTLMIVESLASPDFMMEVEAIAVLD